MTATPSIADYFKTLARYSGWANGRLMDACDKLDEAAYFAERPSFFHSIHGTLNHLLVADRIWLGRMCGQMPSSTKLDEIAYAGRRDLRVAREREDARILALSDTWTDAKLGNAVAYRTTKGVPHETPYHLVLGHFFNHQTHHRAQVHDQLSQTAVPPPELDLIYYLRSAA